MNRTRKSPNGLHTNSKKAKENARRYILDTFHAEDYGTETAEQALVKQLDGMLANSRRNGLPETLQQVALHLWEGGHAACYFTQAREVIADILEQTPEQADSYTPEETWRFYCNFLALHTANIYTEAKKGGPRA